MSELKNDQIQEVTPAVEAAPVTTETVTASPVAATPTTDNSNTLAIAGFVVSIFNLCAWFIPLCGCPMALIGIGLGYFGLKSPKYRTFAIIAIVISALGLVATIINGALGAYMAVKNQ